MTSDKVLKSECQETGLDSTEVNQSTFKCTLDYSIVILCAAACLNATSQGIGYTIGTLFVDWTETFDSFKSQTAWVISLSQGLTYLTGILSAFLCGSVGNRVTAIVGALLATLGMASSAFCTNITQMYGTYGVLTGVGFGIMMTPSMNSIGEHFTEHRSLAMGVVSTVSGFCLFIFPYSFRAAADLLSWRGAHLVMASLIVQCCIMGALLRAPPRMADLLKQPRKAGKPPIGCQCWHMLSLCKDVRLVLFLTGTFFANLGGNTLPAIIVDYAVDIGISKSDGTRILTFVGAGGFCGRILVLPLMKTRLLKGRSIYMFIAGGFLRSSATALYATTSSFSMLSVIGFSYGMGLGAQICSIMPSVWELFGLINLHYYIGLMYWSIGIGSMLGPPLAGWTYGATNSYHLPLYLNGGVCLFASVFHISVACLSPKRPTEVKVVEGGEIAIIYTNKLTETTRI